uniref:hypothetical protein n=1 Tax=Methyloversatilis sp. TaxID=2569862 RepID=UPI0027BA6CE0
GGGFAKHSFAPTEPAGCANPAVGQGGGFAKHSFAPTEPAGNQILDLRPCYSEYFCEYPLDE